MRACVTGGAGFIGSHLVDRLLRDGHDVTVLDNLCTGRPENLASARERIDFVQGDLRDPEAVRRAVRGAEVVFHQAALASVARSVEQPGETTDVNVTGTVNVLLAAREARARRVVFASSSSVYGNAPALPKSETMPASPCSPYAASKAAGECFVAAFQASFGLEGACLRYFNVYGPRQSPQSPYAAVIPLFFDSMTHGRPPVVHGDGGQTRDFTFVEDVADALVLASSAPRAGEGPINIGAGRRTSINELAATIARLVGFRGEPRHVPARVGDVRDSVADTRRARDWLGWTPRTSLETGLSLMAGTRPGASGS